MINGGRPRLLARPDQFSPDVPDGVGHRYGADSVRAWLLLTGPTDLGEDKIAELESLIAAGPP